MSGGVDSSAAAALMEKAGFSVVGVFMKPWSSGKGGDDCLWKEDREYALRAAARLDIPLLTWDLSKEYEKRVVRYMIDGYKRGITPNPDVMCNKFIKFGAFLDKALKLGADYITTGHYVRKSGNRLLKAKDLNKDQSYFLYALTQEQLKRCLFPIGDYKKNEVRRMAKKFGLPNWDKKDSQGVCFIGPLAMDKFLKRRIKPRRGLIVRKSDGCILGEHDGVWYYTIGQRHGFKLSAGKPYFVVGKDVKKNILFVDEKFQSGDLGIKISDFNWIDGRKKLPMRCKVKTRYRQKDLDSVIMTNGGSVAHARISAKNIAVAPGQSAVFYKGNEVLGGGIIV